MSDTILPPTITPAGTQASFIKESPDSLKGFVQRDTQSPESIPLTVSNDELPPFVYFGTIHDPRLQIIHGIPVDIRREGDTYIASWEEAEEFGYGTDRFAALDDFSRTITQLFVTLDREEDTLGPGLVETLTLLRQYLQFRE